MSAADAGNVAWRRSSRSGGANGGGGNCVEVAVWPGGRVALRDSKDPDGARLLFDRAEASAWLAGVKAGRFTP